MITLFIPNRNNQNYLDECLNSVYHQIKYCDRVIFSDNGSTDGSLNLVARRADDWLEIWRTPSVLTYAEHLEFLLGRCTSDYAIFLGADDVLEPDAVKNIYDGLKKFPAASFVCSRYRSIDEFGRLKRERIWRGVSCELTYQRWLARNIWSVPSNISITAWNVSKAKVVINNQAVKTNCIDWALYILLSLSGKSVYINKPLLKYRVHAKSTGNSNVRAHTQQCLHLFNQIDSMVFSASPFRAYLVMLVRKSLLRLALRRLRRLKTKESGCD